jgi:hypothetical protein
MLISTFIFKFLFVLSITFIVLRFGLELVSKFTDDNPEPMNITKTERVFIYLAFAYIITFLIS